MKKAELCTENERLHMENNKLRAENGILERDNSELKKRIAELEKHCSEYGGDALQTSFQLDAANELLAREREEKEALKSENERLKQTLAFLESDVAKSGLFRLSTEREKSLQRAIEEIYRIVSVYQYG